METPIKYLVNALDDDTFFLNIAVNELDKLNCKNLKTFTTAKEFLEDLKTAEVKPKVVLLDYWIGEETNGIAVLKLIKEIDPTIIVILLTSEEGLEIAVATMKHGAYDYVVKGETAFLKIKSLLLRISKEFRLQREHKILKLFLFILITTVTIFSISLILLEKFIWHTN